MRKINLNQLALKVAKKEGLKKNLNIAQLKEVIKLTLAQLRDEWFNGNEEGVIDTIKRS